MARAVNSPVFGQSGKGFGTVRKQSFQWWRHSGPLWAAMDRCGLLTN